MRVLSICDHRPVQVMRSKPFSGLCADNWCSPRRRRLWGESCSPFASEGVRNLRSVPPQLSQAVPRPRSWCDALSGPVFAHISSNHSTEAAAHRLRPREPGRQTLSHSTFWNLCNRDLHFHPWAPIGAKACCLHRRPWPRCRFLGRT